MTRATSPRSRRRIARDDPQVLRRFLESLPRGERGRASTAVKGYVEGPAKLSVTEAIRRFTARRPRDAQAVGATDFDDSGDEDQALSGNQGGEGLEHWLDDHPFVQSIADDTVGAIGLGVIGLATGGLGDIAAGVADAALDVEGDEAAETVASKAAETVASKAAKRIDPVVAGGATQTAQDAATTAQAAIANATTDSTSVLSNTVKAAGEKATQALEDAKQSAKNEVSTGFRNKFREGVGALGLGVIGKRGESAAETYEQEFEADDADKPRQTTDSPGLLRTDADIRQLRGMFGHMGAQPVAHQFGNPWYS